MNEKKFYVYLLASKKDGVLYTGVTSNLVQRIYQHREKVTEGFTSKYFVRRLVYYEIYDDAETAIHREKCIKRWKRDWKIDLFKTQNPEWDDLWSEIAA